MLLKRLFSVSLLTLIAFSGGASAAHPSAQKVVGDVTQKVLTVFRSDKDKLTTDKNYLKQKVDELVVPYMDFVSMSKLILRKNWATATEAQKTQSVSYTHLTLPTKA